MTSPAASQEPRRDQTMDFVGSFAKRFRVPRPVARDATVALLLLLRRFGKADDTRRLVSELPVAAQLLGKSKDKGTRPAFVTWIGEVVAIVSAGARTTKEALKATGLRDAEVVPFVSAFVRHAELHVDRATLARLLGSVPGLARLSHWPDRPGADS